MSFPYELGTVITGTLRPQDLLPRYLTVMSRVHPIAHQQLMADHPIPSEAAISDSHQFWKSEECVCLMDEVCDVINNAPSLPRHWIFGPSPNNPADIGFWECIDDSDVDPEQQFLDPYTTW